MNNFSGNQLPQDYSRPQAPTYGLPSPEGQQYIQPPATELGGSSGVETGLSIPHAVPSVGAAPGQIAASQVTPATPAQPLLNNQSEAGVAPPLAGIGLPQIADDTDLIEKEWVEKAKEIVERTRSDPHAQSKEIQYFRANYIKKRYNKDIKVEED